MTDKTPIPDFDLLRNDAGEWLLTVEVPATDALAAPPAEALLTASFAGLTLDRDGRALQLAPLTDAGLTDLMRRPPGPEGLLVLEVVDGKAGAVYAARLHDGSRR